MIHLKELRQTGNDGLSTLKICETNQNFKINSNDVKIKMKAVGLNQRDVYVAENHNMENPNFILGSDGAGIIVEAGSNVTSINIGDEVIINPVTNWSKKDTPPSSPNILGFPNNGVFSEYVVLNENQVFLKPNIYTWEEAATLSLSALTAYRLLFTKGQLKKGQSILISGISGGVALISAQMALKFDCFVIGTSRKQYDTPLPVNKLINTNNNFKDQLNINYVDLVLDGLGERIINNYINIIKPNGNIVLYGSSSGDTLNISARDIFYPQMNILGSSVGSKEEFKDMYDYLIENNIRPIIDKTLPFDEIISGLQDLKESNQLGNIVIQMDI